MKRSFLEKIRRRSWLIKQPLTIVPFVGGAVVSDLFIWRISKDWDTLFELVNLPGLYDGDYAGDSLSNVLFVFFDSFGSCIFEKALTVPINRRFTVNISNLLGYDHCEAGTFAVFHSHTPQRLQALGSHLSDRGYVSYRYMNSPLCSYVHGNFDAVARLPDGSLQLLGGHSIRRRSFNLQHTLISTCCYELAIVNPTPRSQQIVCKILNADNVIINTNYVKLEPKASCFIPVHPNDDDCRVLLFSHLIMARPLVFRTFKNSFDIFHG